METGTGGNNGAPIVGRIEAGYRLAKHHNTGGLKKMPQDLFLLSINYQKWFTDEPRMFTLKYNSNVRVPSSSRRLSA